MQDKNSCFVLHMPEGIRHSLMCSVLVDDVYKLIKNNYVGGEYAVLGYSMGTIALVETLKRIIDNHDIALPCRVFLVAHEPYLKAELADFTDDKMDEWVRERTIKFGGVPEKLISNNSFWRMYLPIIRCFGDIGSRI